MSPVGALALDALVIGGGPAGSACANRLARRGWEVALVEATDFSGFRIGEIVTASARPLLATLGIEAPERQAWARPCRGPAAAWGGDQATLRPSIVDPYGQGLRVDRRAFDRALFDAARTAGALTLTSTRLVSGERRDGVWELALRSRRGVIPVRSRWVVAATGRGRAAPLAPSRARIALDRLVAIAFVGRTGDEPGDGRPDAVVEAVEDGWWYSARTPDGGTVAVFFTDSDLLPKGAGERAAFLARQRDAAPETRQRSGFAAALLAKRRWVGFDARSSIRRVALAEGWVAVGDAMTAFDPLCGRGVAEALASGLAVADWLLEAPSHDDEGVPGFALERMQAFNDYARQRLAIYALEPRWRTRPFWERRQALH